MERTEITAALANREVVFFMVCQFIFFRACRWFKSMFDLSDP